MGVIADAVRSAAGRLGLGKAKTPPAGEMVRFQNDPYSVRRFIGNFLSDVVNSDNAILRGSRLL